MKICHSHLLWFTMPIQLLLMSTWFHTAGIQCRTMDIWFLNVDMAFLTTDVMVSPLSSYCLFYSLLLVHVVAVSGTMSVNLKNSSINTGVFSCLNRQQAPSEFYSVSSKSRGLNFSSISLRFGSKNGGRANVWPIVSSGSSVANPGVSVDNSNKMPFGSLK